jgi:hypothetical protein
VKKQSNNNNTPHSIANSSPLYHHHKTMPPLTTGGTRTRGGGGGTRGVGHTISASSHHGHAARGNNTNGGLSLTNCSLPSSSSLRQRWGILFAMLFCMSSFSLLPILYLETSRLDAMDPQSGAVDINKLPVSVERLLHKTHAILEHTKKHGSVPGDLTSLRNQQIQQQQQPASMQQPPPKSDATTKDESNTKNDYKKDPKLPLSSQGERHIPKSLSELSPLLSDNGWRESHPLGRGIAGRSLEETPALQGAQRAHIDCDVNVDSLAYWNDPTGSFDTDFQSPFLAVPPGSDNSKEKFITFTPDSGGWNNIR